MPLIQFIGILALLGAVAGVGLAAVTAIWAEATGRRAVAVRAALAGAGVMVAYLTALAIVSLASNKEVLPTGTAKQFCGFYLDCHLSIAVDRVDTMASIGNGPTATAARGTFWVVTVRVANSARRVPLAFEGLRLRVRLANGRWFIRDTGAERASGTDGMDLERQLGPGESRSVRVVFDLPKGTTAPLLSAKEGVPPETEIEGLLLGDEDSVLHPPVLLALVPDPAR